MSSAHFDRMDKSYFDRMDKAYFDRLYSTGFDDLEEKAVWDKENGSGVKESGGVYFDRLTPSLTAEQKMRFRRNIEKRPEEALFKDDRRDYLYKALFNKSRPTEDDNLFSFQSNSFPLNTFQERMYREGMIREPQRLARKEELRTLDVPNVQDDFYLNLLDVSAKNSIIVALADQLVIKTQSNVRQIFFDEDGTDTDTDAGNPITCVHSIGKAETIFNAFQDGKIAYVDVETGNKKMVEQPLSSKVDVATSGASPALFYCGTFDCKILKTDLRVSLSPNKLVDLSVEDITGEICGLTLSPDETKLAVGTNCGKIKVWDVRRPASSCVTFDCYKAAVKALAWSPWERDTLFAGGGSADPVIRKLSTASNGEIIFEDRLIRSQVTSIQTTNKPGEIITCHGHERAVAVVWAAYQDHIIRKVELFGHQGRILSSALNSDKTKLFTLGSDERLKIWSLNDDSSKIKERVKNRSFIFDNSHSSIR